MLCRHAGKLKELQGALDVQHQAALDALRADYEQKLQDAKACALEDLEKARQRSESEIQALKDAAHLSTSAAEQQHVDALAASEKAHAQAISELQMQHNDALERLEIEGRKAAKEASQQLLQEKQRASTDIKKLQVCTCTAPSSHAESFEMTGCPSEIAIEPSASMCCFKRW